jgi:hypothetical protein
MVTEDIKIYLIENDHKLAQYCHENKTSPNTLTDEQFITMAEDVGWVMSGKDYEMHHNTRTLPGKYFIRIIYVPC